MEVVSMIISIIALFGVGYMIIKGKMSKSSTDNVKVAKNTKAIKDNKSELGRIKKRLQGIDEVVNTK